MAATTNRNHPFLDEIKSNLLDWSLSSHGRITTQFHTYSHASFDPARRRPIDEALQFELIQFQGKYKRYIIIDIDEPDAFDRSYDFAAPPNVVLINPENGHGHVIWFIAGEPIWFEADKPLNSAQRYFKNVR